MKQVWLLGLFFLLASCSNGDHFNRGYVISKSQVEKENEPPPEKSDP